MKSIMNTQKGACYICGKHCATDKHHIFGGPNRRNSEKFGLTVYLCPGCHTLDSDSVHQDPGGHKNTRLHREGQKAFEQRHGARCYFFEIFGRSWL